MIRINADTFIDAWKEFSEKFTSQYPDWKEAYNHNGIWSNKLLGGKKSSSNFSPIGNFFANKFGLRYRSEDGSFDLAFSSADNYKHIPCIVRNEISYFDIGEQFYPTSYDIIIEIENNCVRAWQEMTKFTWVHCPLKVLVTYNNKWDKENEMLVNSFMTIISQSNSSFKENQDTEYLLVIGNNNDNNLNWTFYKFDNEGQLKNKSDCYNA